MANLSEIYSNAKNAVTQFFGFGAAQHISPVTQANLASGKTALTYFNGKAPAAMKVSAGKPDDNIFVNYPETIVDTGANYLFGDEVKISIGSDGDKRGEDYLESIWANEQRSEDLLDLATDGGIFGDAWLKIRINEFGDPEIIVLDPLNMYVVSDDHDFRKVLKYVCQYKRQTTPTRTDWYKEETVRENAGWMIREYASTNGYDWKQTSETAWDYDFAPIFHTKNLPKSKSFYGKADLTKSVLDLCRYISRLDSLIGKIIRVHASPKPYARGMSRQDLQVGTEDVLFLGTNPEATLGLLEMTGDLAGAMAYRKMLREALSEISKVPEITTGKTENIGQLSGRAMQILYGPLLKQTAKKRLLYGRMLTNVVFALCEIGGIQVKKHEIKLEWAALIPSDPKEEAETGILLKNCGFSNNTIIKRLGGDPVHEAEMKSSETADLGEALGKAFNAGAENSDFAN